MKAIIKDYLWRWKWVFVVVGILQILSLFAPHQNLNLSLFTVVCCGSVLLSFDLARGTPRVCRSLPVTRRELARSWMFVAIAAPFGLYFTNVVVVKLIRNLFKMGGGMPLSEATLLLSAALLWLGLSFYLLTQLPGVYTTHDPAEKTKNSVVGALWGLSLGGGFFVVMKMPHRWEELEQWHWILLAGGLVTTILGCLRGEVLVMNRVSPARSNENAAFNTRHGRNMTANSQGEGWQMLVRAIVSNTVKATLMVLVFFMVFQTFLRKGGQENWLAAAAHVVREPSTFYVLVPLAMITGLQWLSALRHFRTLPVRSSLLAIAICAFFVLPTGMMLGAAGIFQALLPSGRITIDWVSSMCLMSVPVLLAPGLLLYFGLNWKSYFFVITPIFCAGPLSALLLPHISMPSRLLISVLAWGAGAGLIHRAITRRSQTYRITLSWPAKSL